MQMRFSHIIMMSSCNPYPSKPSAATDAKQFQCSDIATVNKNVPLCLGLLRHNCIFGSSKILDKAPFNYTTVCFSFFAQLANSTSKMELAAG